MHPFAPAQGHDRRRAQDCARSSAISANWKSRRYRLRASFQFRLGRRPPRRGDAVLAEPSKARPGYCFLGEEGGRREGADKSHTWIVDPLDGTTNFLHGIPQFAISIALEREDAIVAGLVYNPANDEMFLAEKGKGAFLNDQRIRVAGRKRLADSVIACGLPHIGRGDLALAHKETGLMQGQVAGLRRFGAAALDLAWIAAGRLDGYWERDIKPWDIAAGLILVREAGGFVTGCEGNDDKFGQRPYVVAGNDAIHKAVVRGVERGREALRPGERPQFQLNRRLLPHMLPAPAFFFVTGLCHISGLTDPR